MPAPDEYGTCPKCQKKFKNKPSLAGRTIACPCGGSIQFPRMGSPATPPPRSAPTLALDDTPSDGGYDFAPSAQPPARQAPEPQATANTISCPSCAALMPRLAALCTNCGYNVKTGRSLTTKVKTGPDALDVLDAVGKSAAKFIISLIVGGIVAVLAGLLWGYIGIQTNYEIRILAWPVGGAAGLAMLIINPNAGFKAGLAAAFFTILGIGIGKAILADHFPGSNVWVAEGIIWYILAVSTAYKLGSGFSSSK